MPEKFVSSLSPTGLQQFGAAPGAPTHSVATSGSFAAVAAAAAAAATFHAPLPPVDQRTYDGRYVWDSPAAAAAAAAAARMHAYHHHPSSHSIAGGGNSSVVGAVGTNPSLAAAELQLAAAAAAAQRRSAAAAAMMSCPPPPTSCVAAAPDPAAAAAAAAAYHHHHHRINPYVDHLYGYPAPSSLRGLSPVDSRSLAAAAGIHPDYMPPGPAQMSGAGLGHRSVMSDLHGSVAPSTIASTDLPFSLESSRLTTPRPGMRQGRKRALSSSPYSDSFDINSMIRFSPNSLVSIMNGSRSGSSTSGSYGHLSAGTISPVMGVHPSSQLHHQLQQHLIRQGTLAATPPFMGHHGSLMHQSAGLTASQQSLILAQQSQVEHMLGKDHINGSGGHSIVHPGMHPHVDQRKNWTVKKEPICSKTSEEKSGNNTESNNQGSDPMKDEPGDFIETNCHWKECLNEFNTQEELVKHINNDHIQANKKSFICRWKDCSRDEKPFKAQYMLVVHMRRHTGEKPHRCTFEGCSKAYSRLENLKTHLRSHTGEKPYMCEFPGCTKAFSNASDRAKHQNRTHSNEKPYVCKAPGCTKRYTDPSSLRKHVKTVHGAEFYANKKHKGIDHCNSNNNQSNGDSNNKEGDNCGNDSSPRSDDGSAVKLSGNLSSPSIKSEDTSSPPQQQHSPSGIETSLVNGYGLLEHGDYADNPISDNNISTTNPVDIIEESEWELAEADELDIPEAAMAAAVIGGSLMSSSVNLLQERNTRNRFKNNLNSKSRMSSLLPPLPPSYPGNNRRTGGSTFIPQTEIKPLQGPVQRKNVDGSFNTAVSKSSVNGVGNRRDSTSTVSSFYGSMRSDNSPHPFGSQMSSRRNSDFSQVSNNRLSSMNSPYDPISPGSSRKSSNVSNFQGISASMTAHLQRLHRRAIENQQDVASTANLVVQTQNMSIDNKPPARLPKIAGQGRQTSMSCQTPQPKDVPNKDSRRASDPVRPLDRNFGVNQSLNRHHSYNNFNRGNMLPPISSKSPATKHDSRNVHHPNANIVLEELDENEPIETNQNLIIPDDMMNYLNQVAENCDDEEHPSSEVSIPISSVSQYAEASSRVPMNMRQQKQTNAYGNNPPTYTTLQPAKQSINNGQYNNQGNQFNNMAPMPVQSNSNQCMAPQNNNSHQQPCTQIMNNVNAMPNNAMYGYQQNNNNGPMNSSGQVNGMCYNHQQRNHQGMHYHAQNQNWNSCSNQMSHNGMMTPSQDSSNNLMPCMPNNINNCNYGHQSPHMCSNQPNQMVNNSGNPQMYCNNHGQTQNTSCMCGNCGSNCMNNIQQQSPTHQLNYTNLMPAKQPSQAASYSQQHNVTANYCFVQQPVQLGDQCMIPNKTPVQGDFMYNPQTQETVLAQTCQKCSGINHCHQAEIQCNDISQSCRPTSKVNGRQPAMRTETYQRTLQYVQQCQQISNDKDQNENVIKKPIRRTSTSTEMSPGCKEVTSTTDNIEKICNSYVAESLDTIPNLGDMRDPVPISPSTMIELPEGRDGDQESCLNTPCMESLKSASHTPLIPNNNMIINDMNSSLANFAEETKYLQLIQ